MAKPNYIKAEIFENFCSNQDELISILNHRMTNVEKCLITIKNDVSWTKKILWAIFGVAVASFATLLIKSLIGF